MKLFAASRWQSGFGYTAGFRDRDLLGCPFLLMLLLCSLLLLLRHVVKSANWNGVALDEFAGCESNLAANRQTRMLADLALVGCYNKTYMPTAERDRIMLASAKRNLAAMSYFGLTEYQKISQYIFEETFNLRFAIPFEQHNTTVSTVTMNSLTPAQRARIDQLNALDLELYAFAKKLMFQRAAVDGGSGGPLPAIGPSAPPYRAPASGGSGTNHSAASATATAIAVAHQNSINHQRAGSGGGGGYGYGGPSHAGDVDKPISAKLNLTTSPSSERRRKKANKQHPEQQRVRKREDTHPTVDAAKLLQR
uniref:Heparan-sulfate 6-O-sulfotransferase n=1 Tax=Anopheles coluzzii TaxID=1518534 RepID=A0A8W7PMN9_ANOCL